MKGETVSDNQVTVVLRTAAGDECRTVERGTTLVEACRLLRVPPGAVSSFATGSDSSTRRIVGMGVPLAHLIHHDEHVVLQFDRNINYLAVLGEESSGRAGTGEPVTEYTFPSGTYGHVTHTGMSTDDCRNFVREAVEDFVTDHEPLLRASSTIVVGTSGGGDSNALLTALVAATARLPVTITPVMLLGIPEWDAAAARSTALCSELGLELQLVDSATVNRLLGRPAEQPDWIGDFRLHFPNDDIDVIGTLAIRLGLSDVATRAAATCVMTGLNLEDLLAECFLRLVQGRLPMPFPVRELDDVSFCYPIHRVPKKILDGCHPKYALANYEQRSVGVMMGRAIPYFLAQGMNASLPGVEFDLLDGFSRLPHDRPRTSSDFGFATVDAPGAGQGPTARWKRFVAGDRPESL